MAQKQKQKNLRHYLKVTGLIHSSSKSVELSSIQQSLRTILTSMTFACLVEKVDVFVGSAKKLTVGIYFVGTISTRSDLARSMQTSVER